MQHVPGNLRTLAVICCCGLALSFCVPVSADYVVPFEFNGLLQRGPVVIRKAPNGRFYTRITETDGTAPFFLWVRPGLKVGPLTAHVGKTIHIIGDAVGHGNSRHILIRLISKRATPTPGHGPPQRVPEYVPWEGVTVEWNEEFVPEFRVYREGRIVRTRRIPEERHAEYEKRYGLVQNPAFPTR